jgi:hypothetical protein
VTTTQKAQKIKKDTKIRIFIEGGPRAEDAEDATAEKGRVRQRNGRRIWQIAWWNLTKR